jgi:hypothetical protein
MTVELQRAEAAQRTMNTTTQQAAKITNSIITAERSMQDVMSAGGGISFERKQSIEEMMQNRSAAENPRGLAAQSYGGEMRLTWEDMFPEAEDAGEGLDRFADSATTAADKLSAIKEIDISDIGDEITRLRDLQEAALSRAYKPDPYMEKNPEFFYNGEKIMKEGQDRIFDGLQTQIEKLQGLQASVGALIAQGAALPQTLVNALIAAGFGNIARDIAEALVPASTPSVTPNPTAVQGWTFSGMTEGYKNTFGMTEGYKNTFYNAKTYNTGM